MQKNEERLSLLWVLTEAIRSEGGIDERIARALAVKVVGKVRHHHQSATIYVAKHDPAEILERDESIRRDYDGTRASRKRLQQRWDVSRATFYRIIGPGFVAAAAAPVVADNASADEERLTPNSLSKIRSSPRLGLFGKDWKRPRL